MIFFYARYKSRDKSVLNLEKPFGYDKYNMLNKLHYIANIMCDIYNNKKQLIKWISISIMIQAIYQKKNLFYCLV